MEEDDDYIELKDVKSFTFSEGLLSDFLYENAEGVSEEFQKLAQLREKDEDIDAMIRIGDRTFHAHKSVLLASSPTLKHFFTSGECKEESPDVQTFELSSKFLDPSIMEPIIEFFYSGKLRIPNEDIRLLCVAVHYLQLPVALMTEVEKCLISQMSTKNVFTLYKLSNRCELEALKENCLKTISSNHEEVLKRDELVSFSGGNLKQLINDIRALKTETNDSTLRENLFHFIIRWAGVEGLSLKRSPSLPSLLQVLPLEKLSFTFFEEQIVNNESFVDLSSYFCSRVLIDLLNKFSIPEHEPGKNIKLKLKASMTKRLIYTQNINQLTKPERLTEEPIAGNTNFLVPFSISQPFGFIKKNAFPRYTFGVQPQETERNGKKLKSSTDVARKEYLYCLGGIGDDKQELSSISRYDPTTNEWTIVENSSITPRYGFAATVINGSQIYIAGGYSKDDTKLNTLQMFDCRTEQLTELSQTPEPLAGCSMAFLNGFLYIAGGENDETNIPLTSVHRYCLETGEWSMVKPMNHRRCLLKLIELNGYLYAIGGGTNTVEKYCPETDGWSMLVNMNYYQESFGAVAHQGSLYVCGPNSFQSFNPDLNITWRLLPSLDIGLGCELISMNGKLLSVGGCKPGTIDAGASVFEFNFFTKEWIPLAKGMDMNRANHCSLVCYEPTTLL